MVSKFGKPPMDISKNWWYIKLTILVVSVGTFVKILKSSISLIGWWFGTMECYDFPII